MEEPRWLDSREDRAWRGYMRMQALLSARLHRNLLHETGLSLSDYEVPVHLSEAPEGQLRAFRLGNAMQWGEEPPVAPPHPHGGPLPGTAAGVLWLAVFESGVHATIAGVILGLLTPAWSFHPPERVTEPIDAELGAVRALPPDGQADEGEQAARMEVTRLANEAISPLARMQTALHPWSAFVVVPLFALANAGVALSGEALRQSLSNPMAVGIIAGLVVGKPTGIVSAALIAVHSGRARMPENVNWVQFVGVAMLGGVGFTVSIFIAGLAFSAPEAVDAAKIGILIASALAGLLGAVALLAKTEPLAEGS